MRQLCPPVRTCTHAPAPVLALPPPCLAARAASPAVEARRHRRRTRRLRAHPRPTTNLGRPTAHHTPPRHAHAPACPRTGRSACREQAWRASVSGTARARSGATPHRAAWRTLPVLAGPPHVTHKQARCARPAARVRTRECERHGRSSEESAGARCWGVGPTLPPPPTAPMHGPNRPTWPFWRFLTGCAAGDAVRRPG